MKHSIKAVVAIALLSTTAPAFAQAAGGALTVDLERIYAESTAARSAQAQLVSRYDAPNKQINAAFESARATYTSQVQAAQKLVGPSGDASKLPAATQQSLAAAQDRLENARAQGIQLQQAVSESQAYVREQIIQAVLPIAEQVRVQRRAAIVIPRGVALAADSASDVTGDVLPLLNQRLATVQIVRPQGAAAARPAAPAAGARPTQGR